MHYHAHVYFEQPQAFIAAEVCFRAKNELGPSGANVRSIHHQPVGPHPTGMFEMHFTDKNHDQVVNWLEKNRSGLNVLIHEDTGNDLQDHTSGSRWLGTPVKLDFGFFEKVALDPSLAINPPNKATKAT